MRDTYELSEETRKTLANKIEDFAEEAGKHRNTYHNLMSGAETDPFAKFLNLLYRPAARLGLQRHYRAKLDAIDARYGAQADEACVDECIAEKITKGADLLNKFVSAMKDGKRDLREVGQLQEAADDLFKSVEKLAAALSVERGRLEQEEELSSQKRKYPKAA